MYSEVTNPLLLSFLDPACLASSCLLERNLISIMNKIFMSCSNEVISEKVF